jgi:hypothetical protein
MKQHPVIGYRMCMKIDALRPAAPIVLHHHERWDGQGYPYGLAGEAIPLGARIFAIADTLDAMTSDRPYRKALSFAQAREEIIRCSGQQFDPDMVKLFLEIPEEELRMIREISLANRQQRAAASARSHRRLPPLGKPPLRREHHVAAAQSAASAPRSDAGRRRTVSGARPVARRARAQGRPQYGTPSTPGLAYRSYQPPSIRIDWMIGWAFRRASARVMRLRTASSFKPICWAISR